MEIKREPLDVHRPSDFRSKQLVAKQMLDNELENEDLESYVEQRVLTTTLDKAVSWARGNSFFPLTFGLACCAIEMMSIVGSRRGHRPLRLSRRCARPRARPT